jgi:hypothetical protein
MNKIYTHQDINQFFNQFKELSNSFEIEKVHQLINNPDARARHLVNKNYKPLKIIIMTSAFIAGTAALILWLAPEKTSEIGNHLIKTRDRNEISISGAKKKQITPQFGTHKAHTDIDLTMEDEGSPGFSGTNVTVNNAFQIPCTDDTVLERENAGLKSSAGVAKNSGFNMDGLRIIELSRPELQKLGIIFGDTSIIYDNTLFEIELYKSGQAITLRKENQVLVCVAHDILFKDTSYSRNVHFRPINLAYLSDESGGQSMKWITDLDDEDKNTTEYFLKKSQFLIPILLRNKDFPEYLSENQIFWFEPSAALFDSLPESIGHQMALEYNYIIADKEKKLQLPASTCVFFETCKSTLDIADLRLYPNPAQLNVTIDFTLSKSVSGWISLVSISGTALKFLVPATTFSEGKNSFNVDISDILPGIYLVLLTTDKGFQTQRLIISR